MDITIAELSNIADLKSHLKMIKDFEDILKA